MPTNLTATLYAIDDLRVEDKPVPEPKDNEVLLKMGCVGICGSDVHYYKKGRCGDFIVKAPMIIGHEASGTVEKCGCKVTDLKPGDRVAIEPGVACKECHFCKTGRYNLCPKMEFCATPPIDGNLRQYYCHAADCCFKLPDNMSLEEGALLEPLAVGVRACKRGHVQIGSTVLVMGSGPIGIVTCITAKAMGATMVMITGTHDHGLEMAKKLGANCVLKVGLNDDAKELAKKIRCMLGRDPDVTIDCAGTEPSIQLGLEVTAHGGQMVVVGFASEIITTNLIPSLAKEIDLKGIFRYVNDYPVALAMVASGLVDVKPLVTHKFDITQAKEAFDAAFEQKGNPIKIMIYCNC